MIKAKRKQHYVWKYYLKAWLIDQKIWAHRNGKYFNSSLQNIAQEREFYKLNELTCDEVSFIRAFIGSFDSHLQESANGWLKTFTYPFNIRNDLNELFKSSLGAGFIDTNNETDALFKTLIINFEEELHCLYEKSAIHLLDKLLQKDSSFFFNIEDKSTFIQFMCVQYMRTQAVKQKIIDVCNLSFANRGVNSENMWNVLSHILAGNMASTLMNDTQLKLIILENVSNVELITGDQPIINTFSIGTNLQPNGTELYYPISPRLAVLLTKSDCSSTHRSLTFEDVEKYNKCIIEKSNLQIFASSKDTLALYFTN